MDEHLLDLTRLHAFEKHPAALPAHTIRAFVRIRSAPYNRTFEV